MSIGLILLAVVAILVLFGAAQRVLDRLRLTDRQALLFTGLIFVGGAIGDIPLGGRVSINLGGALIPLILCVYLLAKAETSWEVWRALIAVVLTGATVFLLGRYFPNEPEVMPFDVNYLYAVAGGVFAYLFGRSRRGAFIAGVLGVMLADITQSVILWSQGINQRLVLGGGGAMDIIVISGLLAVLLCELVGELIERMTRTHAHAGGSFERGEKRR